MSIKNIDNLNKVLIEMKKMADKSNAGQIISKFENSGIINGWDFAIVVQKPGFETEDESGFKI